MKLKIKVKVLVDGCMPQINEKGDWIDLRASSSVTLKSAQVGTQYQEDNIKYRDAVIPIQYVGLGIAMKLPEGFEAIVAPRSSSPARYGTFTPNSIGIIDNSYQGNEDEWCAIISPLRKIRISKGDRICQFRIQPSQKATVWQKLKWLFSSGVELVKVDNLSGDNRGGFGSTGTK